MVIPYSPLNSTMNISRFALCETPFYYYNLTLLQQTLDSITAATADSPNFHVHYALKACVAPEVLQIIAQHGFGADCVSGGEIEMAHQHGFAASDIVFAGVGKADWEILRALDLGIQCFNVESLPELEIINELAARKNLVARVAFRINPNVDAHTHAKITTGLNENKFGLALEDTLPAIRRAASLTNIQFIGLHFHIGSQITKLDSYRELCIRVNELQSSLEEEGIFVPTLNVGGGLGVNYTAPDTEAIPDFASYFSIFKQELQLREGQSVHFELGRSIVAQCGSLISRVLYVKEGHSKRFVIVDAGMTDLIRPAMYGSTHQIDNLSHPEAPKASFDVVGPICESSDVFATDYVMPTPQRGDLLAFRSAGAYGEIMASQYNCRRLPGHIAE